ncbi:MAG: hypothetical protein UY09_C0025G0002 [Parcubacteria group bacterium GW2011_GWA2_47_8]|nr:MAG: hypothetical protein UY09_C0025G0002 [Parcubacteria group bacterium GW2011_GWA2_47_8]OHB18358.1 MAG: hypothetical protein A2666_02940 [Parcubacteria group bacterium RIFCSPHIGHO2_01_FULL_47_10b]
METLALTFDIIGKVIIAYTALAVHHRVWKEHKIDKMVFRIMRRERVIGILGMVLMVSAYLLHIYAKS